MAKEKRIKIIYKEAYKFLEGVAGKPALKKQLEYYYTCKPKFIKGVFKQMIESLKNKQGYVNFIADINQMDPILLGFKPKKVFEKFNDSWKKLFLEFKKKFGNKYKMNINNKRNAWVMYSRGVLSSSKFLSNFNSIEEFDKFVKSFFHNEFTIASLPMLLEKEIFGFGFPLACDFLKELGYVNYGKPDVHLKDIFMELGLVESRDDYEVFKEIVRIGLIVNEDPIIVDKIFWLIGSGNFYKSNLKIQGSKKEFLKYIKNKLKLILKG